jgi:Fic family protein
MAAREYETSHPWITFKLNGLDRIGPGRWMLVGEAKSKCEHLAGAPLRPDVAKEFYTVTLLKGVRATTAIEGNTLTDEQVRGIYDGTVTMPPSRQYQEQEVRNVIEALTDLERQIMDGGRPRLTSELICDFNGRLLNGLELDDGVLPGKFREHSVAVANYRGAPARDCPYLVEQLCEWLEGPTFESEDPEVRFALTLAKAILAHLYIAWIHPFGDGNGRTARLVEFLVLARSGMVPVPASHLLSNHYNLTRDRYYRELDRASRATDILGFISYAVEGFVDGLREQIDTVRRQQMHVSWVNYVHEVMGELPDSKATTRQRRLALAMPVDTTTRRAELTALTAELATSYAVAGPRTLSRDLNRLKEQNLIRPVRGGFRPNFHLVAAFLPPMARDE